MIDYHIVLHDNCESQRRVMMYAIDGDVHNGGDCLKSA